MTRRHIAIFTELGNGHVYPVLPLCSELVKRGHCVTYATSDRYIQEIHETGCNTGSLQWQAPQTKTCRTRFKIILLSSANPAWSRTVSAFQMYRFAFTEEILPQLQRFYQRNVPDLILYDPNPTMIAGRILARGLNCASIQISGTFAQYANFCIARKASLEIRSSI